MNQKKWDVPFARSQFPAFSEYLAKSMVHLDNAGGTYLCSAVLERLNHFNLHNKIQAYSPNSISQAAGQQLDAGRNLMAELLNVDADTLTLGPSTTQNINNLAMACEGFITAGDEIILTGQEHEANVGAWERMAKRLGASIVFWKIDPATGELDPGTLKKIISPKAKILAFTHVSNIIGTINPYEEIIAIAKQQGLRVVVDGVAYAPHHWPNIIASGADAYCFSSYKVVSTHLGIMYTHSDFLKELSPQCHYFNSHKPQSKLDSAGPNHAQIAALAGLADYFSTLHQHHYGPSEKNLYEKTVEVNVLSNLHEQKLCSILLATVKQLPVTLYGQAESSHQREAIISLKPHNISSKKLNEELGHQQFAIKNGHFYALRLLESLGIKDPEDGVLRFSLFNYNTEEEIHRLCDALKNILLV